MSVNGRKVTRNYSERVSYFQRTHLKKLLWYCEKLSLALFSLRTFPLFVLFKFSYILYVASFFSTTPFLFSPCIDFKDFFQKTKKQQKKRKPYLYWICGLELCSSSIFLFEVLNSKSFISSHMHRHGGACVKEKEPGLSIPQSFLHLLSGLWGKYNQSGCRQRKRWILRASSQIFHSVL